LVNLHTFSYSWHGVRTCYSGNRPLVGIEVEVGVESAVMQRPDLMREALDEVAVVDDREDGAVEILQRRLELLA
jgi:hypothetical protein